MSSRKPGIWSIICFGDTVTGVPEFSSQCLSRLAAVGRPGLVQRDRERLHQLLEALAAQAGVGHTPGRRAGSLPSSPYLAARPGSSPAASSKSLSASRGHGPLSPGPNLSAPRHHPPTRHPTHRRRSHRTPPTPRRRPTPQKDQRKEATRIDGGTRRPIPRASPWSRRQGTQLPIVDRRVESCEGPRSGFTVHISEPSCRWSCTPRTGLRDGGERTGR
jgi:hypothetical protein